MKPLVSVLIPTYNQEAYVEQAVRSALEQDYEPMEVVVADDASTDGTWPLLQRLEQQYPGRLVLVRGDTNLGITGNCNRGYGHCRGDLIAMQGGDDVLLPGKITAQVEWFRQHPDGALCFHDCEVFDSETAETICLYSAMAPLCVGRGPGRIIRHMRLGLAVSVMLRRSFLPETGFDSRLPMVSDWKIQIDALSSGGSYGYVDGVLARYRRHPKNSRKQFPVRYYQDCLFTLAIVETEMTSFCRETRLARARVFGIMAIDMLVAGRRKEGLAYGLASFRHGIFSWKFPFAVTFLLAPRFLRAFVARMLGTRVRALHYLGS